MRPYKDINIGDVYKNIYGESEWCVINKNDEEKMIEIIMLSEKLPPSLNRSIWKKNTDKIFRLRVLKGTC